MNLNITFCNEVYRNGKTLTHKYMYIYTYTYICEGEKRKTNGWISFTDNLSLVVCTQVDIKNSPTR